MAVQFYLNGTTGAQDGTLEISDDQVGLELYSIGETATAHVRCPDEFENSESVIFTPPADCEVSFDGGAFGSTAEAAAGDIKNVNVPVTYKRVASTETDLWTGSITTPRLATIPTIARPLITGTLSATVAGANIVVSGLTATAATGRTLVSVKTQIRELPSGEWRTEVTPITMWGTPTTWAINGLLIPLYAIVEWEARIRVIDSVGVASEYVTTTADVSETTYPLSETFSGLTNGDSINGYNDWWVSDLTANVTNCTVVKGATNGLTGAVMYNNAPISSPATSADVECRKLVAVDVSTATKFSLSITPVSGSSSSIDVRFMAATNSAYIGLRYTYSAGALYCYNGSSYTSIKTGLSGNLNISVTPIFNTQTATIVVNGENLGTITVWRPIVLPIGGIAIVQSGAGLTNATTTGFGNVAIERV